MVKSLIALGLAATVGAGMFHTELKSSWPAKDAMLDKSPAKVTLTYSEPITLKLTSVSIVKADSTEVEKLVVTAKAGDGATVEAAVTKPLPDGKYMIRARTSSEDGHVVRNMVPFMVHTAK